MHVLREPASLETLPRPNRWEGSQAGGGTAWRSKLADEWRCSTRAVSLPRAHVQAEEAQWLRVRRPRGGRLAGRIKLPEVAGQLAAKRPGKLLAANPASSGVVQKLPRSCRPIAPRAELWREIDQSWPGMGKNLPDVAKFQPTSAKLGRKLEQLAMSGNILGKVDQNPRILANLDNVLANSGRSCANSVPFEKLRAAVEKLRSPPSSTFRGMWRASDQQLWGNRTIPSRTDPYKAAKSKHRGMFFCV